MRRGVTAALLLLLTSCGQSGQRGENQLSANEKSSAPSTNLAAEANETTNEPLQPGINKDASALPSAKATLSFVGTWATSQAECETRPWRFREDRLAVAGGPNCSFYKVSEVPGGYDLAAQCPAKKPDPTDLIKLRFAGSDRAMLVESNAISPMGLIKCAKATP